MKAHNAVHDTIHESDDLLKINKGKIDVNTSFSTK
jgi:hypothetical protein